MDQSGTAYKNDMCTEHGNEKTCSVNFWEFRLAKKLNFTKSWY